MSIAVPAALLTLTAPTPDALLEIRVDVPAAALLLRTRPPQRHSVAGAGGSADEPHALFVNDADVTGISEWAADWSEVVGGVGQASIIVQNRTGDDAFDFLERDIVRLDKGDWRLFEGEIVAAELDLPVGFPWRRWKLTCSDLNTLLDTRLINVPQGNVWVVDPGHDLSRASTDPDGPRVVDLFATVAGTDQATVRAWFDAYVRAPDDGTLETETYVTEYVPNDILNDPATGQANMVPGQGPLRGALGQLAALAAVPVFDWVDPDRFVHHTSFEGDLIDDAPVAPFEITDVRADWNGVTKIGGRGLRITADWTYAPQDIYVNGNTPFARLASGDPLVPILGDILWQGTGWGHSDGAHPGWQPKHRQLLVEAQATTREQRDKVADAYAAFGAKPRYRGEVTIGGRQDEGNGHPLPTGLRAGQVIKITDARLPETLNGRSWVIMRLSGSLVAGNPGVLTYRLEFGDAPIGRIMERFVDHAPQVQTQQLPTIWPIDFEVLNPKPGESQILRTHSPFNRIGKRLTQGLPVHWEFYTPPDGPPGVRDIDGNDVSGNGESLVPEDTYTDENGEAVTTFTAGSLSGTFYTIQASVPYQDS